MMVTIFRQPGKTGIGIKADDSASLKNGKNCYGSSNERKIKMKLNSIIFCLCAGLCSSALIENAFSMDKETLNKTCKLDSYRAMIVSKYFDNIQDFANLEMTNSKFCDNFDKFHYNPISITPDQLHLWPYLQTLHLYTEEDIDTWVQAANDIDHLYKIEVWAKIDDTDALHVLQQLNKLIDKEGGSSVGVTFRNVTLTKPRILGTFDEGGVYTFNKNVYTNCEQKNSNFVVTSIDQFSFSGEAELTSICVPNSVTFIDKCAFNECTGLTDITIPNGVQSIAEHAFSHCKNLTSVTIPNSVQSIADGAFWKCENAKFIVPYKGMKNHLSLGSCINEDLIDVSEPIDKTNEWIWAEGGDITIPYGMTSIKSQMFIDRQDIQSIKIPNSVTSIDGRAFIGCYNCTLTVPNNDLKELLRRSGVSQYMIVIQGEDRPWWIPVDGKIVVPGDVKEIEDYAFVCRGDIISVEIQDNVQSIGNYAFDGCYRLTSITIPNSVTSIGYLAFPIQILVTPGNLRSLLPDSSRLKEINVFSEETKQLIIKRKLCADPRIIHVIKDNAGH